MITQYKLFEHVKNKALAISTLEHVVMRLEKLFTKMGFKVNVPDGSSGSDYIRTNIEIIFKDDEKYIDEEKIKKILDKYLVSY